MLLLIRHAEEQETHGELSLSLSSKRVMRIF